MSEQDDKLPRDDLDAWAAAEPPAGFADRVVQAREQQLSGDLDAPGSRRRWGVAALAVGAAAAAAILLKLSSGSAVAASGDLEADARTRVDIGDRGVAVAESGAVLAWQVDRTGSARVRQDRGEVFYRVDRGRGFVVETPAGNVAVIGTCFRVAINRRNEDEKMVKKHLALGAAAGALLVVTVYEGSVLFAGKSGSTAKITAGERVEVGPGGAIVRGGAGTDAVAAIPEDLPAPPADGITRDELLDRDEVQRAEIASLRERLRSMDGGNGIKKVVRRGGPGHDADADGPWYKPTQEALERMAGECRVRYDMPPVMGAEPFQIPAKRGEQLGLEPADLAAVNKSFTALYEHFSGEIRQLYIEATGDSQGVDTLSPMSMATEIRDKAGKNEMAIIQQKIARERAGLQQRPADLSTLSPLERYYRLMASMGDDTEQMLARSIGAERAREMRENNGGWGRRMEMAGCPDDDERDIDVDE